jgi:hypothetical protein
MHGMSFRPLSHPKGRSYHQPSFICKEHSTERLSDLSQITQLASGTFEPTQPGSRSCILQYETIVNLKEI